MERSHTLRHYYWMFNDFYDFNNERKFKENKLTTLQKNTSNSTLEKNDSYKSLNRLPLKDFFKMSENFLISQNNSYNSIKFTSLNMSQSHAHENLTYEILMNRSNFQSKIKPTNLNKKVNDWLKYFEAENNDLFSTSESDLFSTSESSLKTVKSTYNSINKVVEDENSLETDFYFKYFPSKVKIKILEIQKKIDMITRVRKEFFK